MEADWFGSSWWARALIVPIQAEANHCHKLVIFTGHNTQVNNPTPPRSTLLRVNIGSVGCATDQADLPDTNILTPGATGASVGAFPEAGHRALSGTFTMGTQSVDLVFSGTCSAGTRCDSQAFELTDPGAGSATASVMFSDFSSDTITYRKAGS